MERQKTRRKREERGRRGRKRMRACAPPKTKVWLRYGAFLRPVVRGACSVARAPTFNVSIRELIFIDKMLQSQSLNLFPYFTDLGSRPR